MHLNLFEPFGDPWRQSMRVYALQMRRHLPAQLAPEDTLGSTALEDARLAPPARYWDQYVRYQRLAKRARADVHHILDHGYAHLAGALPARRIVITFHDAIPLRSGRASFGTRTTLTAGMRRALARHARFVTGSEASRRDAQEFFGVDPSAITVAPLGVDTRFRPSADREALRARLNLTRPTLLIVGHNEPYMNVDGALRAAAHARRQVDLDVIKIGAPLSPAQGSTPGLDGRVRELGTIDDERMREWYAAADLLVYLPVLSGFGLPVLEAMASGTPVLASSCGAVPEVASEAAALVDPRDADAAGDALARLLTDASAREARVERGLARAAAFTWDRTAALTADVYRQVLDGA